jgi:hypothetical protein
MAEPREYTVEEVRKQFLEHIWHLTDYWNKAERAGDQKDRLEGLAFSILSTLDGSSVAIPGFIVAPDAPKFILAPIAHETDKEYNKEQGENWYPENHNSNVKCDIGGTLHELFHGVGREMGLID